MSNETYRVLDFTVAIRTNAIQLALELKQLLGSFPRETDQTGSANVTYSFLVAPSHRLSTAKPFHFIYRDYIQVGRTVEYMDLLRHLEGQINIYVAQHTTAHYLIHAGAVSIGGQGLMLVGPSRSGKSTLTAGLVMHGYRYLSDELAVVHPSTGELLGFPKALSIKDRSPFTGMVNDIDHWVGPASSAGERVWYVRPDRLSDCSIGEPVPLSYIVFPTYRRGAHARMTTIPRKEALRRVLDNSVNFGRFKGSGLQLLSAIIMNAHCRELIHGDLNESIAAIDELVAQPIKGN